LVGTTHSIQRDSSQIGFSKYIYEIIKKYKIQCIAEEIDVSVVLIEISKSIGIEHRIIEPTPIERESLGILSLSAIEHSIFIDFDDVNSSEAKFELKNRQQEVSKAREEEWLRRVENIDGNPILVVCGANHFESFAALAESNGFCVKKEINCWE